MTVGGKLAALGNHTAGANFFDVQVETRVFDSNWGELFYGNATGELNLNAPEGQACYVGGHADTSVADLYAQVDYSGRKYVVLAGAAGDDGESSEATRSFTLPAFMPNLCPKREVPCLNCEVASARPTCEPTVRPTAVPTTWKPSATPTAYPTEDPTVNPTVSPTFHEGSPTPEPTLTPTLTPSESPTRTPTQQPSEKPTQKPTAGPTERPTQTPSLPPTARPSTLVPTVRPTVTITDKPSDSPTLRPTAVPTTG